MNVLYISVHPVLEFDQVGVFEALGHKVFSLGFYMVRQTEVNLRPALETSAWHQECLNLFGETGCSRRPDPASWTVSTAFCEAFDVVVVDHNYRFILENWEAIRRIPVVWRTIGQELTWAEDAMRRYREEGVKIVRWSPEESDISGYIGGDAFIRASKKPEEWNGWVGEINRVVTFNNNFSARKDAMNLEFYEQVMSGLPSDLYGLENQDLPTWRGLLSSEEQKKVLRTHRVAFVTGTFPAPYTLGFIEAWMTGIPVIHVGRIMFSRDTLGCYEIDKLIQNGENGFVVETVEEAKSAIDYLMSSIARSKAISEAGRASAITYFGFDRAITEWKAFFDAEVLQAPEGPRE